MPGFDLKTASVIPTILQKLADTLLNLSWPEVAEKIWQIGKKILQGFSGEGMYEVLDYETTLELYDVKGTRATLRKRERVRYLQDSIIAYQDQAWGDGEILLAYHCTPGKAVDFYRSGYKTHILISRREVKHKGDIDEYHIEWGMRKGFLKPVGFWETEVSHRTKHIMVQVIFPRSRPPFKISIEERNQKRTYFLGEGSRARLPDGRWQIVWEQSQPRLYERYVLKWEW